MADANILQGAIFHDDMEDTREIEAPDSEYTDEYKRPIPNPSKSREMKTNQPRDGPKPAAHRVKWVVNFISCVCMFPCDIHSCTKMKF